MDYLWTEDAVNSQWNTLGFDREHILIQFILAQMISSGATERDAHRPWRARDNIANGYILNSWRKAHKLYIEMFPGLPAPTGDLS